VGETAFGASLHSLVTCAPLVVDCRRVGGESARVAEICPGTGEQAPSVTFFAFPRPSLPKQLFPSICSFLPPSIMRFPCSSTLLLGAILLVGLSAGGCALHTPMSRTLTFHDNATQPAHRTYHGVGFAGTGTLTSTQFLRQEARRRFADEEAVASYIDPVSVDNRSLALYGSYYPDHGFALSATLGTAVGIDATWQIWKRNYLTLSGSPGGSRPPCPIAPSTALSWGLWWGQDIGTNGSSLTWRISSRERCRRA